MLKPHDISAGYWSWKDMKKGKENVQGENGSDIDAALKLYRGHRRGVALPQRESLLSMLVGIC